MESDPERTLSRSSVKSAATGLELGRLVDRWARGNSAEYAVAPRGKDMQEDFDAIAKAFARIADTRDLVSEEDVKNKIVLPILRALGYDDRDFNYERRTGRGYVDVVVDHFPTGIVVESKAPRKKLENYRQQLEDYVFRKHGRDRVTIAILTEGSNFNIYGVTGAL